MSKKMKNKKLLIAIISAVLVLAIAVPIIVIAVTGSTSPIKFLMNTDLTQYTSVSIPQKINYSEIRESLKSGYDLFRVGLTETYFGTAVYVEEGSTMDFTLSAELITTDENGAKEYTEIELPEEYKTIKGYRPYSKPENKFFDDALAEVGEKDQNGIDYMVRDKASKFAMDIPNEERFGEYAGARIRFTIKVTDYVSRYVYLYSGADNSEAVIGDWYCKIAVALASPKEGIAIEEGDIVLYDCIDTYSDGTVYEYLDNYMEITSDYIKYFGGKVSGEKFTEQIQNITEDFTIKAVYKAEDIEAGFKTLGYNSIFDMKEELRIWCYAAYSDGFMAIITKQDELISYPKNLMNAYMKIEEQTWEVEFRESALSMAQSFGDAVALEGYGVTGYATMQEYLDDLLEDHVETLVRELVISFAIADQMGITDELYKKYDESITSYMKQQQFSSRREALETLSANGDEACVFYTNFLSPILGARFAELVEGVPFTQYIEESYVK